MSAHETAPVRTVDVVDPDSGKQTSLVFPPEFIRQFADNAMVEFVPSRDRLTLFVVDAAAPARNKRYKISRHKGSAFVSVPRTWLRDMRARTGDLLDVYIDMATSSRMVVLKLRKVPHAS